MHASAILSLLPLALAAPLEARTDAGSGFTMIATHSTSPIHLQALQGSTYRLYVGRDTVASCPKSAEVDCSKYTTNTTAITCLATDGSATTCAMQDAVPGGQTLYVDPTNGVVGYTEAHSSVMPVGAVTKGFKYNAKGNGNTFGTFTFSGPAGEGLVACEAASGSGYQVFVPIAGKDLTNCITMNVLTSASSVSAWEYN